MYKYAFLLLVCFEVSIAMDKQKSAYDQKATYDLQVRLSWIDEKYPRITKQEKKFFFSKMSSLIVQGADPNITGKKSTQNALYWATLLERPSIIKLLLDHGANVQFVDSKGNSLLMCILRFQFFNECIMHTIQCLQHQIDINFQNRAGYTALMCAVHSPGKIEALQFLLKSGANVALKCGTGRNALMIATDKGNREAVELLLKYGADVKEVDNSGITALRTAIANNVSLDIARILLEWGADPNHVLAGSNITPLMNAAVLNQRMAQLLLQYGADQSMVDANGRRAIDFAHAHKKNEIIPLLKKQKIA